MSEENNDWYIWSQINEIDGKIRKYEEAKREVGDVKTTCGNKKDTWQTSYDSLANDKSLMEVKKTDVFEGKMADSLKEKVSGIMADISSGLRVAESLKDALSTQVTKIETKIQELENERTSWVNQL